VARARTVLFSLLIFVGCAASPVPLKAADDVANVTESDVLRIGVIGDQTGTYDLDTSYLWLERGIEALAPLDLDIVLHAGDLVESSLPEDRVRADFNRAAGLLDRLDVPWLLTPGDHDINPTERIANSADRSREAMFLELLKSRDEGLKETFHRSRRVGNWRIIVLNSHDYLHADPRWGVTFLARLSQDQISWLRDELREAQSDAGIVVLIHQPLWYNWAAWSEVHKILADAGVSLVISGHTHYPQLDAPIDGVTYMTVGATGGSTKRGSASAGNIHHVTELVLTPGSIDLNLIALGETGPAGAFPISPRSAMDRVQAVDVMLGSSGFEAGSEMPDAPQSCIHGRRIIVAQLGNPIDIPLQIDILAPWKTESNHFRRGACTAENALSCTLPPGSGIIFSNNSSVALRSEVGGPFFEIQIPEAEWDEEFRKLTVQASFEYARKSYSLEKAVPATVSCKD